MNIRQNSLEAARMSSNRYLEKTLGKDYFYKMRVYPFHILRENALASGAGADRLSTGMARPYGKVVGSAARVKEGQVVIELRVSGDNLQIGREAMARAASKLPCACKVIVN
jgi:large subunit ribosomal protein L10e